MDGEFASEARQLWETIPAQFQKELLKNVWCSHCGNTGIVNFTGVVYNGELLLKGHCAQCGKRVARVIDRE